MPSLHVARRSHSASHNVFAPAVKTNRRARATLLFSSRLEPSARQATGVPGVPPRLSQRPPRANGVLLSENRTASTTRYAQSKTLTALHTCSRLVEAEDADGGGRQLPRACAKGGDFGPSPAAGEGSAGYLLRTPSFFAREQGEAHTRKRIGSCRRGESTRSALPLQGDTPRLSPRR